jgi:phage-related protein
LIESVNALKNKLMDEINKFKLAMNAFMIRLKNEIAAMINKFKSMLDSICDHVRKMADTTVTWAADTIKKVDDAITNSIADIRKGVDAAVTGIIDDITNKVNHLYTNITDSITHLSDGVGTIIRNHAKALNTGKRSVTGDIERLYGKPYTRRIMQNLDICTKSDIYTITSFKWKQCNI